MDAALPNSESNEIEQTAGDEINALTLRDV
jgi:hypothetical protein